MGTRSSNPELVRVPFHAACTNWNLSLRTATEIWAACAIQEIPKVVTIGDAIQALNGVETHGSCYRCGGLTPGKLNESPCFLLSDCCSSRDGALLHNDFAAGRCTNCGGVGHAVDDCAAFIVRGMLGGRPQGKLVDKRKTTRSYSKSTTKR